MAFLEQPAVITITELNDSGAGLLRQTLTIMNVGGSLTPPTENTAPGAGALPGNATGLQNKANGTFAVFSDVAFSYTANQQAIVAELESTVERQRKQIEVLTVQLKGQATQIQKVTATIGMKQPTRKVLVHRR